MYPPPEPDSLFSRIVAKFFIWLIIVVGLLSLIGLSWSLATGSGHPTHTTVTTNDPNSDCGVFGGCP